MRIFADISEWGLCAITREENEVPKVESDKIEENCWEKLVENKSSLEPCSKNSDLYEPKIYFSVLRVIAICFVITSYNYSI